MADEPEEKEQTLDDIAAASVDQGFDAAAAEPPAETPPAPETPAAPAPQTPESGTQPTLPDTGGQQPPPAEEHAPPHHWSAEDQTTFRGMAPEAKGFVLDRIKAMEAAHTQRSQEIAPMRQVLQKHQTYADMLGMTPHDMVDALVETERVLRHGTREQKVQLLLQMAHDYGITDQDFQGAAQPGAQPEAADDPFGIQKAVQEAVNPLRERLDTFQMTTEQQRLQQEQAYQEQGRQALERFRTETDEQGNAKRPYWSEVLPTMEALAQVAGKAGVQKDIPTLYDEACRAHPEVWEKIQAAEEHKAQLAAHANGAAVAGRQVAANGGLAGGGGNPPKPGGMDLDKALDDAWDKAQAGV